MARNLTTDDIVYTADRTVVTELLATDEVIIYDRVNNILKKISKSDMQEALGVNATINKGGGLLINSDFSINQREVSGTVVLSAGEYGHDRFRGGATGCTYTFVTVANKTTITIASGTLEQEIEADNIQSGVHVLSWEGSSQARVNGGDYGNSGLTATLTGGTNATVEFVAGTIANCKLERGTIPTEYVAKKYSEEMIDCQYYFIRLKANYLFTRFGVMIATSPIIAKGVFSIPMMRELQILPTITFVGNFGVISNTNNSVTFTSIQSISNSCITITMASTNLIIGQSYLLASFSDSTAYIDIDKEL